MRVLFSVALIWLLGSFALAQAQETTYQEGVHYVVLPTPAPTQDPDKIEVAELFWYGCSHWELGDASTQKRRVSNHRGFDAEGVA